MRTDLPNANVTRSYRAWLLAGAFVLGVTLLAPAQEPDADRARAIKQLGLRQADAVKRLERILDDAKLLTQNLRRRKETGKADLLEKAIAIVTGREITLETVPGAGDETERILGDLRAAMDRMHRLLNDNPNNTDEVQVLGKRVVETLAEVLKVLTNADDERSLATREENIAEARRSARRLAGEQEDLRDETQRTVPRTEAERAAQKVVRDLEQLQAMLDKLDRESRQALADVERAQELSARLQALLDQQRRLRSETSIRAGAASELTPRLNREMAEMEAIAKAARKAEAQESKAARSGDLAKELDRLARRQARLAREMEQRAALERASEAIDGGDQAKATETLLKMDGAKSAEMRKVMDALKAGREGAESPDKPLAPEKIKKAIEAEMNQLAARADTARDQKSLERELKAAGDDARVIGSNKARDAIEEAVRRAAAAARKLATKRAEMQQTPAANSEAAAKDARAAEKALRRAQQDVAKAAAAAEDQNSKAEQSRRDAAQRAAKAAERMGKIAGEEQTQRAGLEALARDAEKALKRAAQELNNAADAARDKNSARGQEQARKAAERLERALRNMGSGLRQRGDIAQRQGKVAEELEHLADRQERAAKQGDSGQNGEQKGKAGGDQKSRGKQAQKEAQQMRKAAAAAKQAQQDLKRGDHNAARENQENAEQRIQRALEQAQKAAQADAARSQKDLDRLKKNTERAARQAGNARKELRRGAQQAQQADAAQRIRDAEERMKRAEEEIRRSLKKLSEARPRGAERDRAAAKEQIEKAIRGLNGVREKHQVGDQKTRDELKKIARRQQELEKKVRMLDEQLKRLNERRGREQIQDAQSQMRDAAKRLEEGDSDAAEQAQKRAQKSLEQADEELNEEQRKYRNLHQYQLLFKLRDELKRFQRESQAHRETLQKIAALVRQSGRVTRHINRAEVRPLRSKLRALTRNVSEKSEAIEKERAVVYTYLLQGCATDLSEVESLLGSKEVGLIPQELLGDVVRRFEMAIKGLERELQERGKEEQEQKQQGGQKQGGQNQGGGPRPLVPPDAEIRMILVMQRSLNEERESFLANRPELDERTLTENEKARLRRLYHQQGSLAELFDTLRQNILGGETDGPDMPRSDGDEDGAEGEN